MLPIEIDSRSRAQGRLTYDARWTVPARVVLDNPETVVMESDFHDNKGISEGA